MNEPFDLNPCPRCGSNYITLESLESNNYHYFVCRVCYFIGQPVYKYASIEKHNNSWNKIKRKIKKLKTTEELKKLRTSLILYVDQYGTLLEIKVKEDRIKEIRELLEIE